MSVEESFVIWHMLNVTCRHKGTKNKGKEREEK